MLYRFGLKDATGEGIQACPQASVGIAGCILWHAVREVWIPW